MSKFMSFDFRCSACDNRFVGFVKPDVHVSDCTECGQQADRIISAPRIDLGLNSDKWVRTNAQKVRDDKKFYKEHGVDKKHHSYGS